MTRLHRLWAPAIACCAVDPLLIIDLQLTGTRLGGSLFGVALYALGLQLALAVLAVVAIDELSAPARWSDEVERPDRYSAWRISTRPIGFGRALLDFYRLLPLPALLLTFGLGLSLGTLETGAWQLLGTPSDTAVLWTIWVLGDLALSRFASTGGQLGFVVGLGAAIAVEQAVVVDGSWSLGYYGWGSATLVMVVLGLGLRRVVGRVLQRQRAISPN